MYKEVYSTYVFIYLGGIHVHMYTRNTCMHMHMLVNRACVEVVSDVLRGYLGYRLHGRSCGGSIGWGSIRWVAFWGCVNSYRCVCIYFWCVFSRIYKLASCKVWSVLRGGAMWWVMVVQPPIVNLFVICIRLNMKYVKYSNFVFKYYVI